MRIITVVLAIAAAALAAGQNDRPVSFGPIWADLDTGLVKMSVTAHGGLGYTAPDSTTAGSGFRYPKTLAVTRMYYGGMLCGNDSTYIVDRFYGHPAPNLNKDWAIVESLHSDVWYGGKEFSALMDDSGHPTPKGLNARLHAISLPDPYGNGVILIYDYWNYGSSPILGLYSGIWTDFDISSSGTTDRAYTDVARRMAFQRQVATAFPTCGLVVMAPHQAANLSPVYHPTYVYPTDTCVTEYQKLRWLNGTLHRDSSDTTMDWSIIVSTGPFDLQPGEMHRTAFAVIGCSSVVHLDRKVDSLQAWFDVTVGAAEPLPTAPLPVRLSVSPNPAMGLARIRFGAPCRSNARLNLYDRTGKLLEQIWQGRLNGHPVELVWNDRRLASGVYFLRLEGERFSTTTKAVITR